MNIAQNLNVQKKNTDKQQALSFQGVHGSYSEAGTPTYKFYAPSYDRNKYAATLEIVSVRKNENDRWDAITFRPQTIDVDKEFSKGNPYEYVQKPGEKSSQEALAYRIKLTNKNDETDVKYIVDSGTKAKNKNGDAEYSLLLKNLGTTNIGGTGYHAFTDSFYKGGSSASDWEAKRTGFSRNHTNKAGGDIQGLIEKLKDGTLDPYKWIMTTPLGSGDKVSSHYYWPDNSFQISPGLGNLEDFKEWQTELFAKGKGHLNDGAYTSQGISGFQFQNFLRWGEDSPFANWFKVDSSDAKPTLGVLPKTLDGGSAKDKDVLKNIAYKIVNAPSDEDFDSSKNTYIQFYDKRRVSEETLAKNELIKQYDKDPQDIYEITSDYSSVSPFAYALDRSDYGTNGKKGEKIEDLKQAILTHKSIADIPNVQELLEFKNFKIGGKEGADGACYWDGSVDIAKMNYTLPGQEWLNKVGAAQARNSAYSVATYWTKTTSNTLLEEIAKNYAKDETKLSTLAGNFGVKESEFKAAVDNAKAGTYETKLINKELEGDDFLNEEIINFPLEAIGFDSDLSALLSSAYITPRPWHEGGANDSKVSFLLGEGQDGAEKHTDYYGWALANAGVGDKTAAEKIMAVNKKTVALYTEHMKGFVEDTLRSIDSLNKNNSNKIYEEDNLTEYGKYAAKLLIPDILKYGAAIGLFGEGVNGGFDARYNTPKLEKVGEKGLLALGIHAATPEGEAVALIKKLERAFGEKNPNREAMLEELSSNLAKKLEGVELKDFKVAEAVLDQTGAGLNWRFDAAKDVADLDKRRNAAGHDENGNFTGFDVTIEECLDGATDFWKNFVGNIQKENKSAYTIAEVTSLHDMLFNPDSPMLSTQAAYQTLPEAKRAGYWSNSAKLERLLYQKKDFGKYLDVNTSVEKLEKAVELLRSNDSYRPIVQDGIFSEILKKDNMTDEQLATVVKTLSTFGNGSKELKELFEEIIGRKLSENASDEWDKKGEWDKIQAKFGGIEYDRVTDVLKKVEIFSQDKTNADLDAFFAPGTDVNKAEAMFYEETGATTGSNFSHMFSMPPRLFGQEPETGASPATEGRFTDMFDERISNFLGTGTSTFLNQIHTFFDSHDKPRGLFCMALDMQFFADGNQKVFDEPNKDDEFTKKAVEMAERVVGLKKEDAALRKLSPQAVAVGDLYMRTFEGMSLNEDTKETLNKAVQNLALGKSEVHGKNTQNYFRADGFAVKDFEMSLKTVMEEAKALAKDETVKADLEKNSAQFVKDARNNILENSRERVLQMLQVYQALPGNFCLYSGTELGMTGHERSSKNPELGNREMMAWDRVYNADTPNNDPDKVFNGAVNAIMSLGKEKGMSAIANGTTVS
ncbi:putative maltogenic alpha amylase, partial [Candidatus Gastranaerophilus sp. (ex Termes propinquus)]